MSDTDQDIMDDQEIIAEFVIESREGMAEIENDLLTIEANGANIDSDLVNKVFRTIHSIKGGSGFLGLATIGELAHVMENLLSMVRNEELIPTSEIVEVLLRSADSLNQMIENVDTSNGTDVSDHIKKLEAIAAGTYSAANDSSPASESAETSDADEPEDLPASHGSEFPRTSGEQLAQLRGNGNHIYAIEFDLIQDKPYNKSPLNLFSRIRDTGELLEAEIDTEQVPTLDESFPESLILKVLIATILDLEVVERFWHLPEGRIQLVGEERSSTTPAPQSSETQVSPEQPPAPQREEKAMNASSVEPAADTSNKSQHNENAPAAKAGGTTIESNIRVSVSVLDRLMNLAGELVLGRNQLLQTISKNDFKNIETVSSRLDHVTSELQETIMQTRMQPIGTVFSKFTRVVRDLSNSLNKQCDLIIEGKEVELDKTIIESIGDPLTHLVRNAVDHGIETPEERTQKGKDPHGTIHLAAYHQEGKVNIRISDDGAGIDSEKLKAKALEKGIISREEAQMMSERDAIRLIFHPGFSMAEKISEVSGRGVGMDVVKTNFEKLGGSVDIETKVNGGSTINVRLPLTLAIIPSLIVRRGEDRFAIPQVNISELVRIKAGDTERRIERVKNAEVFRLRGSLLPLVRLTEALDDASDNSASQKKSTEKTEQQDDIQEATNIIVLEVGQLRFGLIVDGLQDSEEIVVKPLGSHLKGSSCLSGATVLGDGRIALILDVAGLAVRSDLSRDDNQQVDLHAHDELASDEEHISTLLFSNHPDEQFGIPMSIVDRIERVKSEQINTVGDQQVLQYRGGTLPLLKLENWITCQPAPEQQHLFVVVMRVSDREVGLITPKILDIRGVPTTLDSTTFQESGILGSQIIDDITTRFIDGFELARRSFPEWFVNLDAIQKFNSTEPVNVLLAEDSEFFRTKVSKFLQDEGFNVVTSINGTQAWQTLCEGNQKFDLVVTDLEMPGMDGFELCQKMKDDSKFSSLPVVALTLTLDSDRIRRGQEVGIQKQIVKTDHERVVSEIAETLTQQQNGSSTEDVVLQTAGE